MAAPVEYSGSEGVLRVDGNQMHFGRVRIHIHGETGDVSASEFPAKRRKPTLQDWEITITQLSLNPDNNPHAPPLDLNYGTYHDISFYPGGLDNNPYDLPGGMVDDSTLDDDVNMLQPVDVHLVCASGSLASAPDQEV